MAILLVCNSCRQSRTEKLSDDWLSPYLERFKAAEEKDKPLFIARLDSVFYHHPNPPLSAKLEYLYMKGEYLYDYRGDKKGGAIYFDSILTIAQDRAPLNSKIAALCYKALEFKGLTHIFDTKHYDSAFEYLARAQIFRQKHFSDSCIIEYTNVIPNTLYQQLKYEDALRYYFLNLARSLNCTPLSFERFSLAQNSLNSIGLCYLNLQQYDSAAHYLDSAYNFINNSRALFPDNSFLNLAFGVVLNTQAHLYNMLSDTKKAEQFYLRSIQLVEKDYPEFSLDTRVSLVNMYSKQSQWANMKSLLDSINKKIPEINNGKEYLPDYYNASFRYFDAMKQYDSAILYLRRYDATKTQLENEKRELYTLDVEAKINNQQAMFEKDLLVKDISIKKSQLWIAILISCIALLGIAFIWIYYKRSARHVKELELLTREISANHEELQHSFAALEQSHSENKKMLRTVAHDLKNPIWGISSICSSMLKTAESNENYAHLDLIANTCNDLLSTINDLLPDKSNNAELQKENVDLSRLLENCTRLMLNLADEKRQKLILSAQALVVPANREKLWRVVSNLVHNAIKFSPTGATIYLNLSRQNNMALLSVRDEGIGIPEHLGERIFLMDDITKSRTGTSGETSYGLGLSISQKIIEQHQGRIWFESEVGVGTVFYVSLPLGKDFKEPVVEVEEKAVAV